MRFGVVTLCLLVSLGYVSRGHAQSLTVDYDDFVDSGNPDDNYGNDGKVKAVSSNGSVGVPGISNTHALLRLPDTFWSILGNQQVQSATFSVFVGNNSLTASHPTLELHPMTYKFTEGTGYQSTSPTAPMGYDPHFDGASWNTYDGTNLWTSTPGGTAGGDYDQANYVSFGSTSTPSKSWFTFNLKDLINNTFSATDTRSELNNFGLLLKVSNEYMNYTGNDFVSMSSSDATTNKPFISYVIAPEPTLLGVFGMLAGLGRLRGRRPIVTH